MHFTELIDLAAERLGGAVLGANDEFFAPKENLLKSRPSGLARGRIHRSRQVDGRLGNAPPPHARATTGASCGSASPVSFRAWWSIPATSRATIRRPVRSKPARPAAIPMPRSLRQPTDWVQLLPKTQLQGHAENAFPIDAPRRFTHLRFNIFPDGGVARLRVYGTVVPDWSRVARNQEIDLAAVENGGLVTACSDMFFGHRHHLILPGPALNMGDGWETRRRRGPGHDWVIIKLGARGLVQWVEVDTTHFKGNSPESCSLEGMAGENWKELLPRLPLQAHTRHFFGNEIQRVGPVTHVRFNIFPDGGVARLRVIGKLCRDGLERLNALLPDEARAELMECCGSARWASRMAAQRPFENREELFTSADLLWWSLEPLDWMEALSHAHRIELRGASHEQLAALEQASGAYRARFSYAFVCHPALAWSRW